MRKIKFVTAIFLTLLLMTSCGTTFAAHGGECRVTVKSRGKSIALNEDIAARLIILAEKVLSDENTGITEMSLLISDEEARRFGREGLSVTVEYSDAHEFPVSAIDIDLEVPDNSTVVTYMKSVDMITVLIDDEHKYIMANGSVFCFPQKYYEELTSYF